MRGFLEHVRYKEKMKGSLNLLEHLDELNYQRKNRPKMGKSISVTESSNKRFS